MRIAVEGKRVNSHRSVGAGGDVVDLSDWVVSLWVGFCCKIKILHAKEVATPHGRFTSILQDPTCESIFTCHARPASRMRGICKGAGEWSRHSRCKYIMSSLCKIQQENYMHAYENIDNLLLKKKSYVHTYHLPNEFYTTNFLCVSIVVEYWVNVNVNIYVYVHDKMNFRSERSTSRGREKFVRMMHGAISVLADSWHRRATSTTHPNPSPPFYLR